MLRKDAVWSLGRALFLCGIGLLIRSGRFRIGQWCEHRFEVPSALGSAVAAGIATVCLLSALWQTRHLIRKLVRVCIAKIDAIDDRLFSSLSTVRARWSRAIIVGLLVGIAANAIIETTPIEQGLEASFVDRAYRLRFPRRTHAEVATSTDEPDSAGRLDEVVVIAIDDDTIARLGWPLPRHQYSRLIERVWESHPASLSFDISLLDPSIDHPEWDSLLGDTAARAGSVYFTYSLSSHSRELRLLPTESAMAVLDRNVVPWNPSASVLPEFSLLMGREVMPRMVIDPIATRTHGVALANVMLDGDDVLRHAVLILRHGKRLLPSLSLRVAADALGVPLSQIRLTPGEEIDLGGKRKIPIDDLGRTLIRYHGRQGAEGGSPVRYVPLWSLLRSEQLVTLKDNPMGDDHEYLIPDNFPDGKKLKSGTQIEGLLHYFTDPGNMIDLSIVSDSQRESVFDVVDESRMHFVAKIGKVRRRGGVDPGLSGKHVFVGATALATSDFHSSPLGAIPGVEYHATMLANVLRDDFFRTAPLLLRIVLTFIAAISAGLIGALLSPGLGFLVLSLGLLILLLTVFFSFDSGLHIPVVAPLAALGFSYGICVLLGFRSESRARARAESAKEFVRQTFGRYLTDEVAQQILDSPDGLRLGGQRRFVTVMMTDLRGFTTMCTELSPEQVVKLINHYLEVMTKIITRYHGTIDEFIGDAILVIFGAPLSHGDEERRAVACALEMQNAMAAVNHWNVEHGLPKVEMGIGVHSGDVVLGNIGSDLRAKYTAMGTTVNLTSRVESYTVGGQVLISEVTRQRCGDSVSLGQSQTLTPKGVKGTLVVHEVLGISGPYCVALEPVPETLHRLPVPLSIRFAFIVEKQVGELSAHGTVEALSDVGMELRTGETLATNGNLLLRMVHPQSADDLLAGDLYCKVLRELAPGLYYLRITAVPMELRATLAAAMSHSLPAENVVK
ncbi:MAG: adenylate/guanylate cyclase domain-containing protein [Polyangia bacterium]